MTDGFQDSWELEHWGSLHNMLTARQIGESLICSHLYSVNNLGGRNLENGVSFKAFLRLWRYLLPDFLRPMHFRSLGELPSRMERFTWKETAAQPWSSWKRGSPEKRVLNEQYSGQGDRRTADPRSVGLDKRRGGFLEAGLRTDLRPCC